MSDEKTITITVSEHESLQRDRRALRSLEGAGVDNWEGYDFVDWSYVETGKPASSN
jgi:hypothetical protein